VTSVTNELFNQLVEIQTAVRRVRELHKQDSNGDCSVCIKGAVNGAVYFEGYPCPTVKALDGEQE
jgi:hypothetical protein